MYSEPVKTSELWRGLVLAITLAFPVIASAEMVVIVHPSNSALIDKATIKKIFMGRIRTFPDGRSATPLDLEAGDVKKVFLQQYLQKDQGAIDSYWARMLFSGNGTPPTALKSQQEVRRRVATDPSAIGYIDRSALDDSVKVINIK